MNRNIVFESYLIFPLCVLCYFVIEEWTVMHVEVSFLVNLLELLIDFVCLMKK